MCRHEPCARRQHCICVCVGGGGGGGRYWALLVRRHAPCTKQSKARRPWLYCTSVCGCTAPASVSVVWRAQVRGSASLLFPRQIPFDPDTDGPRLQVRAGGRVGGHAPCTTQNVWCVWGGGMHAEPSQHVPHAVPHAIRYAAMGGGGRPPLACLSLTGCGA